MGCPSLHGTPYRLPGNPQPGSDPAGHQHLHQAGQHRSGTLLHMQRVSVAHLDMSHCHCQGGAPESCRTTIAGSVVQLSVAPPAPQAKREPDGLGSVVIYGLRSLDVINRGAGSYGVLSTDIQINGCSLQVLQPQGPAGQMSALLVFLCRSDLNRLPGWLFAFCVPFSKHHVQMT